jgi:type IV pilus assembly protein PilC
LTKYVYKAIDDDGNEFKGDCLAEKKEDVISYIHDKSLYPLKIRKSYKLKIIRSLSYKDTIVFCRMLGTLLMADLSFSESIKILSLQIKSIKLRNVIKTISMEIEDGNSIGNSMNSCKGAFNNFFIGMVKIAEDTGTLHILMDKMANFYEQREKVKNKFVNAIMYPIILTLATIGVVFFIFNFVIPSMAGIFKTMDMDLPYSTKIIYKISQYSMEILIGMVINIIILSILFLYLYKNKQYFVDKTKTKIPIIKNLLILDLACNFCSSMSLMLNCNVPVKRALDNFIHTIDNVYIKNKFKNVLYEIQSGKSLYNSLENTDIFPETLILMIRIGEESSKLNFLLEKGEEIYYSELENLLKKISIMMEPVFLSTIGIIIGTIVISVVLPMFNMMDMVNYM